MSKKIAFVNGKGGTGKTTLSLLVAAALKERGQDVGIVDYDPQGNATAAAERFGVPLKPEADFVIIDTSPDIERKETVQALREADLLVVVTRPEVFDLVSTVATAQVIQRHRDGQARTVVVFNQVRPNTVVTREMLEARDKIPYPGMQTLIPLRAAYSTANRLGWNALPKRERTEVLELCIELLSQ